MLDAHSVQVDNGQVVTGKIILIAVGGWPFVPEFPGSELAITSNEVPLLRVVHLRRSTCHATSGLGD